MKPWDGMPEDGWDPRPSYPQVSPFTLLHCRDDGHMKCRSQSMLSIASTFTVPTQLPWRYMHHTVKQSWASGPWALFRWTQFLHRAVGSIRVVHVVGRGGTFARVKLQARSEEACIEHLPVHLHAQCVTLH